MNVTAVLGILFVPMILFITIVIPMWLRLHYREKNRRSRELSEGEWNELEDTINKAERMEQRLATLEKILDDSNSNWRDQQ